MDKYIKFEDRNGVAHYHVRVNCQKCGLVFEDVRPERSVIYHYLCDGSIMPVFNTAKLIQDIQWTNSIRPRVYNEVMDFSGLRRCPKCLNRLLIIQVVCAGPGQFIAMWNCIEWGCVRGYLIIP